MADSITSESIQKAIDNVIKTIENSRETPDYMYAPKSYWKGLIAKGKMDPSAELKEWLEDTKLPDSTVIGIAMGIHAFVVTGE